MTDAAIAIEGLRFAYGGGPAVLDIANFVVPRGKRVFLHGPSGSGKTTLLGILAGILEAPREGHVRVLGQDLRDMPQRARDRLRGANIGYIFQMFNLIPYLNVLDNITLPCQLNQQRRARLKDGQPPAAAAQELARRLQIAHLLAKPVTQLSVGQQQRVAAARALIGNPPLLIADEPTSALDSDRREAFLRLLFDEASRAGATVLFVSHDQSLRPLFEQVIGLADINRAARADANV